MFLLRQFKKRFLFKNSDVNTLLYLILSFIFLTLLYDILYLSVEEMDSIISMFYYNIVTASTVGYGDFSPKTAMGKVLTAIYIPIAISLFAGFLSVLGSMIYKNIHRRDNGVQHLSSEIDYLIIGGFKEKVDAIVMALIEQNQKVVLLNNLYETRPLEYKKNSISWIKGDVVSDNSLDMVDHSQVKRYIVVSSNPTESASDITALYTLEKLLSYSKDSEIFVEVVNRLNLYPKASHIRYINIAKGILIAKEVLNRELLRPLEKLLDNQEKINQYNISNPLSQSWQEIKKEFSQKGMNPIGYINTQNRWLFFPDNQDSVDKGATVKVLSYCENIELSHSETEQDILLVGDNSARMSLLMKNYKLDKRYSANSFKTIASIGAEMLNIKLDKEYSHIIIFAEPNSIQNDTLNYFYWRYFRDKFPHAKIIVELLNAKNRRELEEKYEDRNNEFVSIFQIGLMVQELQDDGIIHLVESLTKEEILKLGEIEKTLSIL